MLTPNQIYDYLRYYCYTNEKNAEVLHFSNLGSKNLWELVHATTPYVSKDLQPNLEKKLENLSQRETSGMVTMFDQEPLDINAYCMITKEFL